MDYVTWHGAKTCASILLYGWGGRKGESKRREDSGVACFGLGMGMKGLVRFGLRRTPFYCIIRCGVVGKGRRVGGWVGGFVDGVMKVVVGWRVRA